jgi:hypothetical protein
MPKKEVDADLYDFLLNHETRLYTKDFQKNKTVFAIVFVDFSDLSIRRSCRKLPV